MLNISNVSQCPVFNGVSEKELQVLLKKIHYQVKNFLKDELIAAAGDPVNNLYIILSGSVRGEMIDYSGKIVKIEDIEAPKPLAAAFLFGRENAFPVTVTANCDVQVLSVPVAEFLKLLQLNKRVLVNYLNSISTRTQFLSQKIHFLNFKTIKEKVAHYLLQKAGDNLHSIELKSTQQQLADLFGVTRPALARVLGEMQRDALIEINRKTIRIPDKKKLNNLLRK